MKKIISILTASACVVSLAAGCSSTTSSGASSSVQNSSSSASTPTSASSNGAETTFKVGFDAEYPPYGYMDDKGEYVGFDLELAQKVCEINGWKYEAVPINWDSKDMELNSGSIDCIWNGFTINGREEDYTWSKPYIDNSQVVLVAENSGIESLADLSGKNVGVQAASAALDALNSEENADLTSSFGNLQEFSDYNSAFVELQAGSIDAVVMDVGVANYQVKSRGEGFKILDEAVSVEQYGIGFKKGNEELKNQVEEALNQLVEDGTFDELAEKYGVSDLTCLGKD